MRPATELHLKLTPFDQKEYRRLIEARGETIQSVVRKLKPALGLSNALDAGCGVGFFTQTLAECGLSVCGFDGRPENVAEARRRFPEILFEQLDVQNRGVLQLGHFDLVLCFGLMYHLENPLLAIRNLREMTEKCLLLESMCLPEEKSSMLLRAEPRQARVGAGRPSAPGELRRWWKRAEEKCGRCRVRKRRWRGAVESRRLVLEPRD